MTLGNSSDGRAGDQDRWAWAWRIAALLERWWWVWVPGIAVVLRVAYLLLAVGPDLTWGDEGAYDTLARNVAAGHCYCFTPGQPSVLRAPLYPLVLAGLYVVADSSHTTVLAAQVVAGGLGAYLTVIIGRALQQSDGAAIVAGFLFACHPLLIFATGLLYPETIYLVVLLLFVLAGLKSVTGRHPLRWAALSGGLLGISVLMKPNLLLLPLPLAAWYWYALRGWRRALARAALVALLMGVVVAPWTARNYRVTGSVVPVSANGGINLWQGNHPAADGAAFPLAEVDPLIGLGDVERDRTYMQWAVARISEEPGHFVRLAPLKIARFFSLVQTANRGRVLGRYGLLVDALWFAFIGVSIWGAVRTARLSRLWGIVYLMILYPVGLAVVFYGATRYSMVTYPFLFLLASEPICWLARRASQWLGSRDRRPEGLEAGL